MQISSAYPSRYIKSHDVEGEELKVTINTVTLEQVGMGGDQQPVIYFRGWQKGMVLNKTNAKTIARLYGDDTDKWKGKEVLLYSAQTQFQGEVMQGLRIKSLPERIEQEMPTGKLKPSIAQTSKQMLDTMQQAKAQKPMQFEDGKLPWEDGEPADTIVTEGEGMARAGIQSFRSWRDALSAPEYERLKPHVDKLTSMAQDATAKLAGKNG